MNTEEKNSKAGYTHQQQSRSSDFASSLRPRPDETQKVRKGKIVNAIQIVGDGDFNRISVEIRFDEDMNDIQQATSGSSFILSHTVEEIAMLFGDLEDLIGRTVQVVSSAGLKDQGVATIISNGGRGNIRKANVLRPFGTLLAPAGN